MKEFQTNDPSAPFNLFHLFDNYPALKAAWDSVPGDRGNALMAEMLREDLPIGAEFMHIIAYLLDQADDPGLALLDDLKNTLGAVTATDQRLYGHSDNNSGNPIDSFFATEDPAILMDNFYSLLDEITTYMGGDTPKVGASVMAMGQQIFDYMLTKTPAEVEDTMGDIMEALTEDVDPADGTADFRVTFADLMDLAAPLVSMADYPMWVHEGADPGLDYLETDYASMNSSDSDNSELGNSAKGLNYLLSGMFDILNGETIDRDGMYDMFDSLNDVLADPTTAQKLIWNIANHFTPDGYHYGTLQTGFTNIDTNVYNTDSPQVYSNADIRETVKEFLTASGPLFMQDKRRGSFASPDGSLSTGDDFPLTGLLETIKKIYLNWDTTQLSESIYDLIRYDMFGRDRTTDANAYSASILEHLLYLGAIAGNMGWEHLENANEVNHDAGDDSYEGQMAIHGHGAFCGNLTLNDSLYSIQGKRDALAQAGTYELGFDSGNGYRNRGYNRTYRSRDSFTTADRANYTFHFNVNYPALKFLAGFSVGDYGTPTGGNPSGGGGNDLNEYAPYSANGVMTKDLASWTFAHVIRACWEGEGPYYSTQGATVSGGTTTYYRPDGRIYATVTGGVYTYPVDGGNDAADPDDATQRYNRYKATWHSDYYMIETAHNGPNYYVPLDEDDDLEADETTTGPKYREYTELIAEDYSGRACASQEEAIFRNFQWVMNEKRMTLIIPLWLAGEPVVLGCPEGVAQAGIESVLYQIIEGNGITGLSNARKYRSNGVWAKQNNNADLSNVPGDYRIIVLATPIRSQLRVFGVWMNDPLGLTAVDADKIYIDTIGRGTATPGGVSHNIFALSRFGFPRSKAVTLGSNYTHYLLGSRNVNNATETLDSGFTTANSIWTKRNSLLPMFIALLAPLHTRSYYYSDSNYNNALARQLEGLNFLLKPMIYFNYNAGSATGHSGVGRNGWLPRIQGDGDWSDEEYEATHSRSLMSDWDVDGFVNSTSNPAGWHGGWGTLNFYTPADLPTLLSVMMDSDTSATRANADQRADGLLAKLVSYDANPATTEPDRPTVTEVPGDPWEPDTASIHKILYGLEQLTSGMKSSKAKGTLINEQMSDGTLASIKQLDPPEWRFQKRTWYGDASKSMDLDLDDLLDKLVGEEADEMINSYHDNNADYADGGNNGVEDWDWVDFNDTVDDLYDLVDRFLTRDGENVISEQLFNVIDVMAQHSLTQAQVKGLQYVLAKMLAYFDDDSDAWVVQGEPDFEMLLHLLVVALPNIDAAIGDFATAGGDMKGQTYLNLITALKNSTKEGALVPWIIDTVSINPYSSEDFITQLADWMESDLVSAPNTRFYSLLARMLGDMGDQIGVAPSEEGLRMIYEYYGFQPF